MFRDIQIVIITNFVVVSIVGIRGLNVFTLYWLVPPFINAEISIIQMYRKFKETNAENSILIFILELCLRYIGIGLSPSPLTLFLDKCMYISMRDVVTLCVVLIKSGQMFFFFFFFFFFSRTTVTLMRSDKPT